MERRCNRSESLGENHRVRGGKCCMGCENFVEIICMYWERRRNNSEVSLFLVEKTFFSDM